MNADLIREIEEKATVGGGYVALTREKWNEVIAALRERIEIVKLEPGDALVVRVGGYLTMEYQERLRERIRSELGGDRRVVVLHQSEKLDVLREKI